MNNREIDALVAEKVMDQAVYPGLMVVVGKTEVVDGVELGTELGSLPRYTEDIAAAWQVAMKMNERHEDGTEQMQYERWVKFFEDFRRHPHLLTQTNGEASLSICLAALKAVGVEVKE